MFWKIQLCITRAGPAVLGCFAESDITMTCWRSLSELEYRPLQSASRVVGRMWPRSSSMYWICAMCCANSSVIDSELNEPWKVEIDDTVPLVKSAVAGAVVGLFGFLLSDVRSVEQAATATTLSRPTESRLSLICVSPGWRLRSDGEVDADVTRRRHGSHVEALRAVAGVRRVLGIVVREIRPGHQVAPDERKVQTRDVEPGERAPRHVVAE